MGEKGPGQDTKVETLPESPETPQNLENDGETELTDTFEQTEQTEKTAETEPSKPIQQSEQSKTTHKSENKTSPSPVIDSKYIFEEPTPFMGIDFPPSRVDLKCSVSVPLSEGLSPSLKSSSREEIKSIEGFDSIEGIDTTETKASILARLRKIYIRENRIVINDGTQPVIDLETLKPCISNIPQDSSKGKGTIKAVLFEQKKLGVLKEE